MSIRPLTYRQAYLSAITVTNRSQEFYLQDGGKNQLTHMEQNYVTVTLRITLNARPKQVVDVRDGGANVRRGRSVLEGNMTGTRRDARDDRILALIPRRLLRMPRPPLSPLLPVGVAHDGDASNYIT